MSEGWKAAARPVAPDEALAGEAVRVLRRLIDVATRRWRVFVALFAGVAVAIQIVAFLWPGTYAAVAAVELQRRRYPAPITPDRAAAPTLITTAISEEELNSQVAVLTSQEVLEKTVAEAGLDRIPPRWYMRVLLAPVDAYNAVYYRYHDVPPPSAVERAVRGLRDALHAEPMKDSNVLAITYEAGNPRFAQAVLDVVLKHYLAHALQPDRSRDAQGFFDDQAARLKDELTGYEDRLLALKQQVGAGDLAGELNVRLALDAELRKEDWELRRQAAELDRKIDAWRATLAGKAGRDDSSTTVARNDAALQLLQDQLLKLELERVHLVENYAPDSPKIADNQRKIDVARRQIAEQDRAQLSHRTTSTSPAFQQVETDLEKAVAERAGIAARQQVLAGQLADSRAALERLDAQSLQATRLQRLVDVTASKYETYLKSGEAARIDAALDADRFSNVTVVQGAAATSRPVRPKKLTTLLLSLAGGILAGVAGCAWLELRAAGWQRVVGSLVGGTAEAT
ncbi:MAG TPA: GNVR domain-containing protein [Candidatus Binatia bacterium]|nr:GNVR domain-containing protein [Candidatus Binatia bacterium]